LIGNNNFEQGTIKIQNVSPTISPEISVTSSTFPSGIDGPIPLGTTVTMGSTEFTDPGLLDTHDVAPKIENHEDGFKVLTEGYYIKWDTARYQRAAVEDNYSDLVFGTNAQEQVILDEDKTLCETDTQNGTINSFDHTYSQTGIYTVKLRVQDKDGGFDTSTYPYFVVVYDPSAGFASGSGTIHSPLGAYDAKQLGPEFPDTLGDEGEATFGFVSKYKKGKQTPDGTTSFVFVAGNLEFESTSMDWLVISGARAQYQGDGLLTSLREDGTSATVPTRFMLSAQDCDVQPVGSDPIDPNDFCTEEDPVDKFRIKIFLDGGGIVYDNEMGQDEDVPITTGITSGSIVVHKGENEKGGGKNN